MDQDLIICHDMHNRYGESLTWKSLATDERFSELWRQCMINQRCLDYRYQELLLEYVHKFRDFFGGFYPISFHGHASDALMPTTIASLLLHLEKTPCSQEVLQWNDTQCQSPRLAISARSFGTGYGPLASICPYTESSSVASGPPPIVVDLVADMESLRSTLEKAKENGCVAFVIQVIESRYPWNVITPECLRAVSKVCANLKLPLIVDETATALRCGAPFAHQRQEYLLSAKPDLVIFGKGLQVSGIGINFEGNSLRLFDFERTVERVRCVFRWNDLHTRAIKLPNLIEALFILDMAKKENWPGRSRRIGQRIRDTIWEQERKTAGLSCECRLDVIAGLDSLIYIEKHRIEDMLIQGIPEGSHLRLLPVLDDEMSSSDFLRRCVMGIGSIETRRRTSELLKKYGRNPLWCYVCGDATEEALGDQVSWCDHCCIATCGYPECAQGFSDHHCLSRKAKL